MQWNCFQVIYDLDDEWRVTPIKQCAMCFVLALLGDGWSRSFECHDGWHFVWNLTHKMGDDLFTDQTQDEFAATNPNHVLQLDSLWSEFPRFGTREHSGFALASSVCWTTEGRGAVLFLLAARVAHGDVVRRRHAPPVRSLLLTDLVSGDLLTGLTHRKKTPFPADVVARCSENNLSRATCSC